MACICMCEGKKREELTFSILSVQTTWQQTWLSNNIVHGMPLCMWHLKHFWHAYGQNHIDTLMAWQAWHGQLHSLLSQHALS